jgi:hypothetical protein
VKKHSILCEDQTHADFCDGGEERSDFIIREFSSKSGIIKYCSVSRSCITFSKIYNFR